MAHNVKDFKKKKEEEKARQSGELAPEVDVESGKMINPHNPEYITKRPWYLGDSGPSLKHHAKQRLDAVLSMSEADQILQRKKVVLGKASTFRKGACENCGSMTHKKIECLERPRSMAKSAKVTGMDIAADEAVVNLADHGKLSYDGKRDAWQGFQPDDYAIVVERYNKIDEERRRRNQERKDRKFKEEEKRRKDKEGIKDKIRQKLKEQKEKGEGGGGDSDSDEKNKTTDSADSDSDSDSDSDYDSDEEEEDDDLDEFVTKDKDQKDFQGRVARQGGVGGAQMKTTVRNLRIREDTAKYLRNLDPNSAYYDPKTRSMRDNPLPHLNPDEIAYAGDNRLRYTGDTGEVARMQLFAWEAQEVHKLDIHPEANPTAAILAKKKFEEEQGMEKEKQRQKILDMYGADKFQQTADSRLRMGATENWLEYSRDGRVIKGAPKAVVRSKYQEDVVTNNHTSVFGSWYDKRTGRWGYKCCHSLEKNAYCLGEEGKQVNESHNSQLEVAHVTSALRPSVTSADSKLKAELTSRSELFGENLAPTDLDPDKLKEALMKQQELQKGKVEADDRKRKYNSMATADCSKEEMEAYKMSKRIAEDPMANFKDAIDDEDA